VPDDVAPETLLAAASPLIRLRLPNVIPDALSAIDE
jgi:hypothetical protein